MAHLDVSWDDASPVRRCAWSSLLAGLCVASNFSFGVVAATAHAAGLVWIIRTNRAEPLLRLAAASILPGFLATAFLVPRAIVTWPAGQLGYGADGLLSTFGSVIESSLHKPNRYVLNLFLMPLFEWAAPMLFPLLALSSILCALFNRSWKNPFAVYVASVFCGALALHWILFLKLGMKLPLERTALFIVLLVMLWVTSIAASMPTTKLGSVFRRIQLRAIVLTAVYFVSCLRLNYFKEWGTRRSVRPTWHAVRTRERR